MSYRARFAMHRVNHQEAYSLDGDIYTSNAESFFLYIRAKSVFIQQKSSRALSKSSLNPGAPYQRRLSSILWMRAEYGLVRVFWRGVLEQPPLRHPPWTHSL